MSEIEIQPIAILISFLIWLDINIKVFKNFYKNNYKTKADKFREKARAKGNYVVGREIKSKYYSSWRDDNGKYYEDKYKVIYEYIVNGKTYKKKLYYKNSNYPREQNIYYKTGNPRNSIAETERKYGLIYTMLLLCPFLSVFIGIPILAMIITTLINMF